MRYVFVDRRRFAGLAALAILVGMAAPAAAGGSGSSKSKVNVRVKSFVTSPIGVGVANKNPTITRTLADGQVTQYQVNKGKFTVRTDASSATYNSGQRKTVYVAITDSGPEDTTTKF